MFKGSLSSVLALSAMLTSFEGSAAPKIDSDNNSGNSRSSKASSTTQPSHISVEDLALFNEITTSGPTCLNIDTISELLAEKEREINRAIHKKFTQFQVYLQGLEDGSMDVPFVLAQPDLPKSKFTEKITSQDLKDYLRGLVSKLNKTPDGYGLDRNSLKIYYKNALGSPSLLLKGDDLNKILLQLQEYTVEKEVIIMDAYHAFMGSSKDTQWNADNIEALNGLLQALKKCLPTDHASSLIELTLLKFKCYDPLLRLCTHLSKEVAEEAFEKIKILEEISISRDIIGRVEIFLQKNFDCYNELTNGGKSFPKGSWRDFQSNLSKAFRELEREKEESIINSETFSANQVESTREAVDAGRKNLKEKNRIAIEQQKAEEELNRLKKEEAEELKRLKKQKASEKAHQKLVEAIKRDIAQRQAEALSLQLQADQAKAKKSISNKIKYSQDKSREGLLMHWYFESHDNFNKRKETQQKLATLLATQQRKANAKTAKNHEINPERAQSAASSSSTSSSSSALSSSASSTSSSTAPTAVGQSRAILGSNHYKTLESLLTDKNSKMKIESVRALFEALGGYVDTTSHSACRVGMGLRHIDTGKAELLEVEYDGDETEEKVESTSSSSSTSSTSSSSTADVRMVMHATHAQGKNGRKGLRPEQILDIRKMLTEAGYTLETVISKVDATSESK